SNLSSDDPRPEYRTSMRFADTRSVPDDENAFEGQLQPLASVERFEKPDDSLKILRLPVHFANRDTEIVNVMHHARLKKILEELVVNHSPACFDLDNHSPLTVPGIGLKPFLHRAMAPKKHRHTNLLGLLLA
ncbi:MAG: hypothetical protein ACE5JI_17135, partial [Acidobacteriota bacterium]